MEKLRPYLLPLVALAVLAALLIARSMMSGDPGPPPAEPTKARGGAP